MHALSCNYFVPVIEYEVFQNETSKKSRILQSFFIYFHIICIQLYSYIVTSDKGWICIITKDRIKAIDLNHFSTFAVSNN